MNDVYQAPTSNLDADDEQTAMVRQLFKQQSYVGSLLGAVFGLIPGLILTYFVYSQYRGFITIMILLIPGIVTGLTVKFCARAFEAKVRLPAAILTALVTLLFFLVLPSYLVFFIAFLNGLIVMGLSRRILSYEQEKALYAHRIGKVRL